MKFLSVVASLAAMAASASAWQVQGYHGEFCKDSTLVYQMMNSQETGCYNMDLGTGYKVFGFSPNFDDSNFYIIGYSALDCVGDGTHRPDLMRGDSESYCAKSDWNIMSYEVISV
ncbi:uncharacterized protein N7483_005478 [Penicillium malachiteum]|uniref:uncharacterized protein n=1 Tax=Penicillium malachiteum TaxID=1324776 RepID=UPI002546A7C4|nr:uncharacterized protein N7483_005478 [Penicillium malachiteum]KAJ5730970.1 hypothetical protein N7483_005478 [Penicillium malachiteum]